MENSIEQSQDKKKEKRKKTDLELAREEIATLRSEAQIKNMFIVNLNKQCIALKLELGRKLTLSEIEFLKKSCI